MGHAEARRPQLRHSPGELRSLGNRFIPGGVVMDLRPREASPVEVGRDLPTKKGISSKVIPAPCSTKLICRHENIRALSAGRTS